MKAGTNPCVRRDEIMTDNSTMLDSPLALTAYLEALFREPPVTQTESSAVVAKAPEAVETADTVESRETSQARSEPVAIDQSLQVLLLDVWGLRMAVPVTDLNGILKWPQRLIHTPTRDPARIGMIEHRGRSIPVLDLLLLLDAREQVAARAAGNGDAGIKGSHVLLVGDERWGLACTGTRKVMNLEPGQIQPVNLPGRPWYLGTVKDQLCALIDLAALMAHVEEISGTNPASV